MTPTRTRRAPAARSSRSCAAALLAPQGKLDPAPRPTESSELEERIFQGRIEHEGAKIGGAGFNFPALEFQRMAELQMGVGDILFELERFSVRVLGLRKVPGFFQCMTVLHPDRRFVGPLLECLAVISGGRYPVACISRPVGPGEEGLVGRLGAGPSPARTKSPQQAGPVA